MTCEYISLIYTWSELPQDQKLIYWNQGYRYYNVENKWIAKSNIDCYGFSLIPDPTLKANLLIPALVFVGLYLIIKRN